MSDEEECVKSVGVQDGAEFKPKRKMKLAENAALDKVFFISEELLNGCTNGLNLEKFYHPGKGEPVWFITNAETKQVMEILEFAEPRRCWLIDESVCSNGKIYITTPIDVTFLALHYVKKHCAQRALDFDSIGNEEDVSVMQFLSTYVDPKLLRCIATVRQLDNQFYYKYDPEKTLAWLGIKTQRIATALQKKKINCGVHATSKNFIVTTQLKDDVVEQSDYIRTACDIVGDYIDAELHEELENYLEISKNSDSPTEIVNKATKKRKSQQSLQSNGEKKVKMVEAEQKADVQSKLELIKDEPLKPQPPKERILTAKEKALAKGAKGTKSISSFFKK